MPVLTLEKPAVRSLAPAFSFFTQPLRMPAWAVAIAVFAVGITAFAAGRHKPAHHYVKYFGYPLVLDTTTGKACYAAKPSDPVTQDAAFAIDGASDTPAPSGPAIPMCGND